MRRDGFEGIFTVEEVLQEIDKCGSDDDVYESGSEDDFEGYVDEEE